MCCGQVVKPRDQEFVGLNQLSTMSPWFWGGGLSLVSDPSDGTPLPLPKNKTKNTEINNNKI